MSFEFHGGQSMYLSVVLLGVTHIHKKSQCIWILDHFKKYWSSVFTRCDSLVIKHEKLFYIRTISKVSCVSTTWCDLCLSAFVGLAWHEIARMTTPRACTNPPTHLSQFPPLPERIITADVNIWMIWFMIGCQGFSNVAWTRPKQGGVQQSTEAAIIALF